MNRINSLVLGSLIVTLILSACAGAPIGAIAPQQAKATQPLRVEYTQWWGDYTLLVAQDLGLFEKHGVKVEPIYYEVFSKALPDLAANKIDVGLFGIGDLLNVSRHVDVKGVAVYDSGGYNSIVSIPEVQSVADLKGKRLGVQMGTNYELFIQEVLRSGNLTTNDVVLINMDPEVVPERLGKDVDAAYTWEPYTTQAIRNGGRLLASSDEVHSIFPDVLTVRKAIVDERPEEMKAFLKAWFEAVEYRKAHPDESNAIIAELTGVALEDLVPGGVELYTNDDNLRAYADELGTDTSSIFYSAKLNLDFLVSQGVITLPPSLDDLLDPSYLN